MRAGLPSTRQGRRDRLLSPPSPPLPPIETRATLERQHSHVVADENFSTARDCPPRRHFSPHLGRSLTSTGINNDCMQIPAAGSLSAANGVFSGRPAPPRPPNTRAVTLQPRFASGLVYGTPAAPGGGGSLTCHGPRCCTVIVSARRCEPFISVPFPPISPTSYKTKDCFHRVPKAPN